MLFSHAPRISWIANPRRSVHAPSAPKRRLHTPSRQLELRFLCFSKSFSSRSGWMLDVTRAVGQLHRKQFVKSRSDLEALGFQQHASDIVVLGRVADEQIHFSHEVPEQFGGFDQFPRFKRAEQASLAVFFLAGIFSFY